MVLSEPSSTACKHGPIRAEVDLDELIAAARPQYRIWVARMLSIASVQISQQAPHPHPAIRLCSIIAPWVLGEVMLDPAMDG
jgi:hypothetical protein